MTGSLSRRAWPLSGRHVLALALSATLSCGTDPTGPAPGAGSPTRSVVTVSRDSVVSGTAADLMLELRDAAGRRVEEGGRAVAFQVSGGGSTGEVGPTTDLGDGRFVATFVGIGAGTAATVGATIDGEPVTTPLPTIRVTPGPTSMIHTTVDVSPRTVVVGGTALLELVTRDGAGNPSGQGGRTVAFTATGGTAGGSIGPVTDHATGRYTAEFTASAGGTPLTIGATVDGAPVASSLPILTVARGVSADSAVLTISADTISWNAGLTIRLEVRDSAGVPRTSGGEMVRFQLVPGPGSGMGTVDSTTDHGDGSYTADFLATQAGSALGITATLNGQPVGGPMPMVTILSPPVNPQQSTVTISSPAVEAGQTAIFTAVVRNAAGDTVSAGISITFTLGTDGSSGGTVGPVVVQGNGTHVATFTAQTAGSAVEVGATINDSSQIQMLDSAGVSHLPSLTVVPGPAAVDSSGIVAQPEAVELGDSAAIVLTLRDQFGNRVLAGGDAVSFERSGGFGVSEGTVRPVADLGDGRYRAQYVATLPGSADTLRARVNGAMDSSRFATVTVVCSAGPVSLTGTLLSVNDVTPAHSPVQQVSLPSGVTTTITLRARDQQGCPVTSPMTVQFGASGGSSTGVLGPVVDHGDGTYTATFTGRTAGSAVAVRATVNGDSVTSTPVTITVVPGDISPWTSVATVSRAAIDSGARATVTLVAHDSAGNRLTTGGRTVAFSVVGGAGHGVLAPTVDHQDGTYTATYTGMVPAPGAPDTILARIDGTAIKTALPTIAVVAGGISASASSVSLSAGTVSAGDSVLVTLSGRDAAGRPLVTGDRPAVVAFALGAGATGVFGPVQNADDGTYFAHFIAHLAGGPTALSATIDGVPLGTAAPTITVVAGAPSPATSAVTSAVDSIGVNDTVTVVLRVLDAFGNPVADPGLDVAFTVSDPSLGGVGAAGYLSGNQYTAVVTALAPGTLAVGALLNGSAVSTPPASIRIQ
ncbi:MAG TPA: invasin domain 3-containing protein [Gemmatimonadales bacterium]|nr:invasin domain 3-containing protein [Gemmatimonadales bacterium]